MTLHAEHTIVGVRKLWPDTQALTGGTATNASITGLSGLTSGKYDNGLLVFQNGSLAGKVFHILTNTTTKIYVDRSITGEGTPTMASTYVSLYPWNYNGTDTTIWIMADSVDFPTPVNEWDELFSSNSAGVPYWQETYKGKISMEGTLEFTVQDAKLLPLIMGYAVDTGTARAGVSTTLKVATQPGTNRINVNVASNATSNDYVRVGGVATGEIRKISSINGSVFTLDKPLRRNHLINASVTEMNGTGPYTHTYTEYYDNLYRLQPFILIGEYTSDGAGADTVTMYHHCFAKGFTFKNDGSKLTLSIPVVGYYFSYANGNITAPTAVSGNVLKYQYSAIGVNGVTDGMLRTFSADVDYGAEAKYFHNNASSSYPRWVDFKRSKQKTALGVRVNDDRWLDLLTQNATFYGTAQYNWNSTNYLKIQFSYCRANQVPHKIPAGGAIETDIDINNRYFTVTVVDSTYYH